MGLRKISSWFFAIVVLSLMANAMFLFVIDQSFRRTVAVQEHRHDALELAERLHRETEELTSLVRSYAATGEPRFLVYYYDILAIRAGEKVAPPDYDSRSYWDDVIAGRIRHTVPANGERRSVAEAMKAQRFGQDELRGLQAVVDATSAMTRIEQVAFAATQGLYNPDTQEFVSDGTPHLDFASRLVNSQEYDVLKANLSSAVDALIRRTDERTRADVVAAEAQLSRYILLSIVTLVATVVLAAFAVRMIRSEVLQPIHHLGKKADRLASGDYATRTGAMSGVSELTALGRTLDLMAQAVEDDIAARHSVQKELEAARTQAEYATRAKSMFLANMSHEIRTPMNAILGMSYLALGSNLSSRQHDYVSKIHNAARSLLGIINDILDFSKVEAGKFELEDSRFRVEDVAGNALALLRQRAHEKDIELLFDVSESRLLGEGGALMGDALRLGQVLSNLLSNAVKFTHAGHVKLIIGVEDLDDVGETLRFTIQDTGIGMTDAQIGRLFQEFTQADGSTTRKYGGTGLGLTIAKKIVELMGGRIWVESVPNKGSSFIFTARFALTRPPAPPSTPLPHAGALRVLVVDDQLDARIALGDLLGALGVGASVPGGIAQADDGDTALAMIEAAERAGLPYDVLLLDWIMPRMDGASVLRALQGRGRPHPLPVVVSAYDSESMHQAAEALGARHFVAKPVLPESLRDLVRWLAGEDVSARASPTDDACASFDLSGMRVLLVEDNPINQQIGAELLQSRGAEVIVCENGRDAVADLHSHPPDHYSVVLMDLQMPEMDGYEATRLLRLDERFLNLPIIAVSAHAMTDERQRCMVLGMNGHISKPIEPETLFATLAELKGPAADARPGPMTSGVLRGEPSPRARELELPGVIGLDLRDGLRRSNGNRSLYLKLLTRFAHDYGGYVEATAGKIEQAGWADARRDAHTLRGLAASLGAGALAAAMIPVERALQDGDRAAALAALAHLADQLVPLVNSLRAALEVTPEGVGRDSDAGRKGAGMGAGAEAVEAWPPPDWLPRFRQLLRQSDADAKALWEQRQDDVATHFPAPLAEAVSRELDRFDFAAALRVLGHSSASDPVLTSRES